MCSFFLCEYCFPRGIKQLFLRNENADMKPIKIEEGVKNSKLVVEVPSGKIKSLNIKVGEVVTLK